MPLGTVSRRRGAPARPPEDWSIFLLLQKEGGALHITTPSEDVAIPSCGSQNLS
jgi:hypothetical protein